MSASDSEHTAVREEPRGYREIATEYIKDPPASFHRTFLVLMLFVNTVNFIMSGLIVLSVYGFYTTPMIATIKAEHGSLIGMVEFGSAGLWVAFVGSFVFFFWIARMYRGIPTDE